MRSEVTSTARALELAARKPSEAIEAPKSSIFGRSGALVVGVGAGLGWSEDEGMGRMLGLEEVRTYRS